LASANFALFMIYTLTANLIVALKIAKYYYGIKFQKYFYWNKTLTNFVLYFQGMKNI
jgi:hypothetical protein